MFDKLKAAPTAEQIEKAFRFPPPAPFVKLVQACYEEARKADIDFDECFEQITGLYASSYDARGESTPIEVFPFGRTGMDGVCLGFVIHDEKLGPNFPVGISQPYSLAGTSVLAPDAKSAFDLILSSRLRETSGNAEEAHIVAMIERVAVAMGISPASEKIDPENTNQFKKKFALPAPKLPPDWKLAMTPDGLGVAAEAKLFAPDQRFDIDPSHRDEGGFDQLDYGEYAEKAAEAEEEGFLGTALFHLRVGCFYCGCEGELDDELYEPLYKLYKKMGRTLHAKHLKHLKEAGE